MPTFTSFLEQQRAGTREEHRGESEVGRGGTGQIQVKAILSKATFLFGHSLAHPFRHGVGSSIRDNEPPMLEIGIETRRRLFSETLTTMSIRVLLRNTQIFRGLGYNFTAHITCSDYHQN